MAGGRCGKTPPGISKIILWLTARQGLRSRFTNGGHIYCRSFAYRWLQPQLHYFQQQNPPFGLSLRLSRSTEPLKIENADIWFSFPGDPVARVICRCANRLLLLSENCGGKNPDQHPTVNKAKNIRNFSAATSGK
jgi:hypothetical protein